MTIEQKAREIAESIATHTMEDAARLGIIEGHFIAARLLQEAGEFDAEIIIRRAIERDLIEEQKV